MHSTQAAIFFSTNLGNAPIDATAIIGNCSAMPTNAGYMPASIIAGESIWISASNTAQSSADLTFDNFTPAGGYTLAYRFASATPATVSAAANGANTGWTIDISAATTAAWKAGAIAFAGVVTHTETGRVYAVDSGSIAVTASPLATSAWTAVVAACDAALLTYAGGAASFSVDGQSYSFRTMDQLIMLRDYALARSNEELGSRQKRIIRTRFT